MDFNQRAGTRIKNLRESAHITQEQLLKALHDWGLPQFTQAQMSHWEAGRRPLRLEEAHAIAGILGVEMSVLLEGTTDIDLAALEVQQQDALAGIAERQSANAERLAKMHELDRQIRKAGGEIDYYKAVVHNMERRIANLRDGEEEEDAPNDCGYEEI